MASKWIRAESLIVLIMVIAQFLLLTASSAQLLPPSVPDKCKKQACGRVDIPYPFWTSQDCYFKEDFFINCTTHYNKNSHDHSPKPYIRDSDLGVLNISLDKGELQINTRVFSACYNMTDGTLEYSPTKTHMNLPVPSFWISVRNKFTVTGCNTGAFMMDPNGTAIFNGCLSMCSAKENVTDGKCEGIGCCQTAVPEGLQAYNVSFGDFSYEGVRNITPCVFAFLVNNDSFLFHKKYLAGTDKMNSGRVFNTVIQWVVSNETCEAAKSSTNYACKSNSECIGATSMPGYTCRCSRGYEGNPYLGCTDINECAHGKNNCTGKCKNTMGGYTCSTPVTDSLVFRILVGVVVGFIVLLLSSCFVHMGFKKRKLERLKQRFKQNGGLLLQQLLHEHDKSASTVKIFTVEELEKATDCFDESRIVGRGGYGTVYKGFLPNDTVIAIKKSHLMEKSGIEQFINEVVVLSQINHRNVVKLLGCCLETEVPLLVYEFVSNGTLYDHLHNLNKSSKMTWEARLRIATETASVLSYLHSATSIPIIHRDIKSTNILLDDNYTSKVSDFGASRLVPFNQTQLSTMVQGTLGYLDPEYLQTSQLTEKSDVYSFGVVLIELITGKKALSFDRPEEERSLAMHFLSALKEDRLFESLEEFIVNEENSQQVKEVADLARRCVRVKGEERPSMKEVALELEGLRAMVVQQWVSIHLDREDAVHLLGDTSDSGVYSDIGIEGFTNSSVKKQVMPAASSGR